MNPDKQMPKYFDQLSSEDQKSYLELHSYLSSKECRNNRGQRLNKFSEILNSIHCFCIKNDENDVKRCMVCGVFWLPPKGLAINIRQLHILLDKCKSSINGSLQRMGYNPLPPKNELVQQLIEYIPSLKNNFPELREWTIRTQSVMTPQPEPVPINSFMQKDSFQSPNMRNCIINSKYNNDMNNKGLVSSISFGSYADVQNNGYTNNHSPFSTPQPSIYSDQFMQMPQTNVDQAVSQSVSFSTTPTQYYNPVPKDDIIDNSFEINNFDNDSNNYFDDPFCLPPSSLFDDEYTGFTF